jgi:hypothetical protein
VSPPAAAATATTTAATAVTKTTLSDTGELLNVHNDTTKGKQKIFHITCVEL